MNVKKTPLPEIPSGEMPTVIVGETPGITVATGPSRPGDGTPPEQIATYRRLRQLGAGGMGQVYLAEDNRLKRQVALKLLRAAMADEPAFVDRFLREAKTMAQVNHPNVVGIHGAGEQNGWLWMALEYVPGTDLNKLLKARGRLEEPEVLRILIACCKGLEAIHAAGLVHRDLKPANIFIDRNGEPKIGDLGLARHTDGEDRMTLTGHAWGTPAYMSPEQVQGIANIDIRSDVYALGVVAFILLTGTEPFTGPTSYVVTNLVLSQQAPDVRSRNRSVSQGMASIIRCCLEKDRAKRFDTPLVLKVDLERLMAGLPLASTSMRAPPPSAATAEITPQQAHHPSAAAATATAKGGGGFGRMPGNSPSLGPLGIKLVAYSLGGLVLGGVIWSVKGQTVVERPVKPLEVNLATASVEPAGAPLEPWMGRRGKDATGEWASLKLDGAPVRLRLLPAGTFQMGSPPNEPGRGPSETLHQVTLSHSFWMAETEVTQEFYHRFVPDYLSQNPGENRPADRVNWHDVSAFLLQLGNQLPGLFPRLPTEAEWEYACRGGGDKAFGHTAILDPREWVLQPPEGGSRKVAQGQANAFGLFDLHGNVREWCKDTWEDKPLPATPETDPLGHWGSRVVCRGGSYLTPATAARCAARQGVTNQERAPDLGFRLVIDATP